jgi:hypothetical protein
VFFNRGAQVTLMVLCASSETGRLRSNAATTSASVTSFAFWIQSHRRISTADGRAIGSLCTIARNSWSSSGDTCHPAFSLPPIRRYKRSMGSYDK